MITLPNEITYDLGDMLERIEDLESANTGIFIFLLVLVTILFGIKLFEVIFDVKRR